MKLVVSGGVVSVCVHSVCAVWVMVMCEYDAWRASGCDVSLVYLCSCGSLDNCHTIVCVLGGGHTVRGASGLLPPLQLPCSLWGLPCPLCPLHLPLLNSTPQSPGFPPASLQKKVLWPSCLIAVIYGAFPPPGGVHLPQRTPPSGGTQ